jgi:hypothetical protein
VVDLLLLLGLEYRRGYLFFVYIRTSIRVLRFMPRLVSLVSLDISIFPLSKKYAVSWAYTNISMRVFFEIQDSSKSNSVLSASF